MGEHAATCLHRPSDRPASRRRAGGLRPAGFAATRLPRPRASVPAPAPFVPFPTLAYTLVCIKYLHYSSHVGLRCEHGSRRRSRLGGMQRGSARPGPASAWAAAFHFFYSGRHELLLYYISFIINIVIVEKAIPTLCCLVIQWGKVLIVVNRIIFRVKTIVCIQIRFFVVFN